MPAPTAEASQSEQANAAISEEIKGEDIAKDLVRRKSRVRGSTIQTSFRGVLSENSALVPQRKNLLGE